MSKLMMLAGRLVSRPGRTRRHIIILYTHRSIIETSRKDLGLATYSVWAALFVSQLIIKTRRIVVADIYLLINSAADSLTSGLPRCLYYYSVAAEIGFPEWVREKRPCPPAGLFAVSRDAECVRAGGILVVSCICSLSALLAPQVPPLFVPRELLEIQEWQSTKRRRA